MSSLLLKVVDRTSYPIPRALAVFSVPAGEVGRCTTGSNGTCHIDIQGYDGPIKVDVTAEDENGIERAKETTVDSTSHSFDLQFDCINIRPDMRAFYDRHFTALLGSTFLILAIFLAFYFPLTNQLQRETVRGTFSLAAGGFVAEFPGFLNVHMKLGARLAVQAGGALAVFVLTYFFLPA